MTSLLKHLMCFCRWPAEYYRSACKDRAWCRNVL